MKYFLTFTISITAIILATYFGRLVPFAEQWPLFESLRTTAAIIFGVVGAWFAIIYPERLKLSFGENYQTTATENPQGVNRLFTPIVHSTCILSIILVIGVIAPLIKTFKLALEYKAYFRGLSFGLLTLLTLWQMFTILQSLVGPDLLKSNTDNENKKRAFVEGFTILQKKE